MEISPAIAPRIAVMLPCYNEAVTIAGVIAAFRKSLPEATIYVFDNASDDDTGAIAAAAGAIVRRVSLRGKGNVVRRMFADVDADVYVMADGDGTYAANRVRDIIAPVLDGRADMVVGTREGEKASFPAGHRFGNWLFNRIVGHLFGQGLADIFSGYRAFSRRFTRAFPAHSSGFEIETELSIFVLEQRIPFEEIPTAYGVRPEGSASKLRTYRDGWRILWTILRLFKESRPLEFFMGIAAVFLLASLVLGVPVIWEWHHTGLVERLPTAVLASGLGLLSALTMVAGLVLDSVARSYRETRHLRYLNVPRQ